MPLKMFSATIITVKRIDLDDISPDNSDATSNQDDNHASSVFRIPAPV